MFIFYVFFPKDGVGVEIDDKIRKVENENKRLQMELEFFQDKYRTLNHRKFFFLFFFLNSIKIIFY